jgi:hypothetical protein
MQNSIIERFFHKILIVGSLISLEYTIGQTTGHGCGDGGN